ncbi:hypothetical protein AMTR_s00126p00075310, partial [Amborella trichopoda]
MRAMVETGVTHNLLSDREAAPLSLTLAGDTSKMKVVNLVAKSVVGIIKDVLAKVGNLNGQISLMAMPLDEFKVILQLDFLMLAKESVVPHLGVVAIMDKQCPCRIKTRLQQGHTTYLVALLAKEIGGGLMVHPAIMGLLEEYNNLMPQELPKMLHTPHAVNQCINLKI